MAKPKITAELLGRVLAREPRAVREFVAIFTSFFLIRIGRVLLRNGNASRRDAEDLCQDTFIALLQDDGRLIRAWDPARGLSFENYCGLIAEHRTVEYLRKKKEELLGDDDPCAVVEAAVDSSRLPERIVASRELLWKVFEVLRAELSELGGKLFELLFVDEREVVEVCALMNMEKDAVYAWRSRLGRRIAQILTTLGGAE